MSRRTSTSVRAPFAVTALMAAGFLLDGRTTCALAQPVPPPCETSVTGRLVAVEPDGSEVTILRRGKNEKHPVAASARATLKTLKSSGQVTLDLNCKVRPPAVVSFTLKGQATTTPSTGTTAAKDEKGPTTVLMLTKQDCTLSVDMLPRTTPLKAGQRNDVKVEAGQRYFACRTADGREWNETIKVGAEQVVVEVEFGAPAVTLAEYDAQAGKLCKALVDLKAAGDALDIVLRKRNYKFHEADSTAVATASASWAREYDTLKGLVAPETRAGVFDDFTSIDKTVREYGELVVKALQTAQERNSVMGEAGTLRDKAKASRPLMKLPERTLKVLPGCGGA